MSGMRFDIIDNLTPNLKRLFEKLDIGGERGEDFKIRATVGIAFLNGVLNGTSESVVPPIQKGILRGSGSVFVNSEFVGDSKAEYTLGTPSDSYQGKKDDITIGFNTAYAARWHEQPFVPGGRPPHQSSQSKANPAMLADVGWKYIEKHLKSDGKALLQTYADLLKKAINDTL